MRTAYSTDLSNVEWSYLEPYLPPPKATGRPRFHHTREILDAIFYLLKSGCAWRLLPHDFPPWKTLQHYFSGFGASTAPGRGLIPLSENASESAWSETLSRVRA